MGGAGSTHGEAGFSDPDDDRDAQADAILVKELRKIPLDERCSVDLDITRLDRPRLAAALTKSEEIRASAAT